MKVKGGRIAPGYEFALYHNGQLDTAPRSARRRSPRDGQQTVDEKLLFLVRGAPPCDGKHVKVALGSKAAQYSRTEEVGGDGVRAEKVAQEAYDLGELLLVGV